MAQASEPTTKTPPYAASIRPKFASDCRVAMNPYSPSAMTPAPAHAQPRCSRTACQTCQAPPISATAARMNRTTDGTIVMQPILAGPQ